LPTVLINLSLIAKSFDIRNDLNRGFHFFLITGRPPSAVLKDVYLYFAVLTDSRNRLDPSLEAIN
jgi:hypothetical protein